MAKLCIIPARGGSKRIVGKNTKNFLGKPIILYAIEAALKSGVFDTVMVSTDEESVADLARKNGAEVPFLRSSKNADDFAPTVAVIIEVLAKYSEKAVHFDTVCCLYATAPFVTADLLQQGIQQLTKGNFDSVFPVITYNPPIQRALKAEGDKIVMVQPEMINERSQDLTPRFFDAGQFYWLNVTAVIEKEKLWTDNSGFILLDEMSAHDIDNPEDWIMAEYKFQQLNK